MTYTWTFLSETDAVASLGNRTTESAASPATTKATVVKKPKTACARLREECIVGMTMRSVQVSRVEASEACLGAPTLLVRVWGEMGARRQQLGCIELARWPILAVESTFTIRLNANIILQMWVDSLLLEK